MWIAEKAVNAPVQPPWAKYLDKEDGSVFYYNAETKQSVWTHPYEPEWRSLVSTYVFMYVYIYIYIYIYINVCIWVKYLDKEDGSVFYYNAETKQSVWTHPYDRNGAVW
jgi:hypothetical protein